MSEPHQDTPEWEAAAATHRVDAPLPTGPAQRHRRSTRDGTTAVARPDGEAPLLEVHDVSLRFGGVVALDHVSFALQHGEIFGLIGPNGAGKTTCFNAMTGIYRPTSGFISFRGQPLTKLKKHSITRLGIARTFQNIRLFPEMTALENVMVGADAHHRTSVPGALLRLPRHWREERRGREKSMELLRFVGIADRAAEVARNLSYGQQRRLEIARALATEPALLCLDEPAAGLNPRESAELNELLLSVRQDHATSILLIEHDMSVVMQISDHVVVLEYGRKISDGSPQSVRTDPRVIAAYLGVEDEEVEKVEAEVGL